MKNKLYLACYSHGDYDDISHTTVFVSEDLETVKAWVNKYNRILKTYKPFYESIYYSDENNHPLIYKALLISEYNQAYYLEIEKR